MHNIRQIAQSITTTDVCAVMNESPVPERFRLRLTTTTARNNGCARAPMMVHNIDCAVKRDRSLLRPISLHCKWVFDPNTGAVNYYGAIGYCGSGTFQL